MTSHFRKKTTRILSTVTILAIFIATLGVVTYAAYDDRVIQQNYSIATGETVWDGKAEDKFMAFTSTDEVRLNVSIQNPSERTITATLKRVRPLLVDTQIKQIVDFTGKDYDWKSVYFTPNTSYTYYMRIEADSTKGVNGRYSCDQ